MKIFLAIALIFLTGLAHAQAGKSSYVKERDAIMELGAEGKLSILEVFTEIEAAGRAHYPTDTLLHVFNQSNIRTARQFEDGLITADKAMELITQRTTRFEDSVAARNRDDEAQRQGRARAAEADWQAAQAAAQANQRSQAIGNFLSGMAKSMNRNFPPPITCRSTGMAGVVTTNCQ